MSFLGDALGPVLGYIGQKDTNSANAAINRDNLEFNKAEAKTTRIFNRTEARLNRRFQARMSNTAVLRRMKDMRKAGINPILAGRYEASQPNGAMAAAGIASAPSMIPMGNEVGAGLNAFSAMQQNEKVNAETANVQKQTEQLEMIMNKIDQEIQNLKSQQNLTDEQAKNVSELTEKVIVERANLVTEGKSMSLKLLIEDMVTKYKLEHPGTTVMHAYGMEAKGVVNTINTYMNLAGDEIRNFLKSFKD
jgi:cytochrome b involved in lipid metabolism